MFFVVFGIDDTFIVGEKNYFKIISIRKKIIFKDIKTGFSYNGICYIKDKIILIVTGSLNTILFKYIDFDSLQKNLKIKVIVI